MTRSLVAAVTAAVGVAGALGLAGCGPSAPAAGPAPAPYSAPVTSPGSTSAPGPAPAPVPGVPALTSNPTDTGRPSQAQAGTDPAPTTLRTQDVVAGAGNPATLADTVDVRYTGTLYTTGKVFDSSWSRGDAPIQFPLNAVVPGFAQGIAGMKPGGRRVIVIPPDLGYGSRGTGPIPANSTLVFVVDLVSVS